MKLNIQKYLQGHSGEFEKIGEGRYREAYRVGNKVLKLLKKFSKKEYSFFPINFPTKTYAKLKFGISDFNEYEYNIYKEFIKRVPNEFKNRFAEVYNFGFYNDRSASLSELITDITDRPSQPLSKIGKINDSIFWERFDELEEILLKNKIFIMDIVGKNILMKISEKENIPVLMDYKRYGKRTYPFQFILNSQNNIVESMRRKFQRVRDKYKLK